MEKTSEIPTNQTENFFERFLELHISEEFTFFLYMFSWMRPSLQLFLYWSRHDLALLNAFKSWRLEDIQRWSARIQKWFSSDSSLFNTWKLLEIAKISRALNQPWAALFQHWLPLEQLYFHLKQPWRALIFDDFRIIFFNFCGLFFFVFFSGNYLMVLQFWGGIFCFSGQSTKWAENLTKKD